MSSRSRRQHGGPRAQHRLLSSLLTIALLAVAIGGWAWAADRLPLLDQEAAANDPRELSPPGAPLPGEGIAAGGADEVAREPGLPAPTAARRPLVVRGDEALRELAANHGHGGDGTPEHPILFQGESLAKMGADEYRFSGTRLHVVIAALRLEGEGDGIALRLTNVTDFTVRGARLASQHTAILIEDSSHVRIENARFTANHIAVHLVAARDVTVSASQFTGNTHGVFVSDQTAKHAASERLTLTGNAFDGNGSRGERGSAVVLAGRAHHVESNVFSNHHPAGLRVTGPGAVIQANGFTGGDGHGIALVAARAAAIRDNTLSGHLAAAIVSFDGTSNLIEDNRFDAEHKAAVHLVREDRAIVRDNEVTDSPDGVSAWNSTGLLVATNRLSGTDTGVRVFGGSSMRLEGNTATNWFQVAYYLSQTTDAVITENTLTVGGRVGIYLGATTSATATGNRVMSAEHGILITGGATATRIQENQVMSGAVGIRAVEATGTLLRENELMNQQYGIVIGAASKNVHVEGGLSAWNEVGVMLEPGASAATVTGVEVLANRFAGVAIVGGQHHTLSELNIHGNTAGLLLIDARSITIETSRIFDNRIGLHYMNSTRNLAYNNHIANHEITSDQNVLLVNSPENQWNVTRRAGPNIIGGPWIAGNHWHDYDGADANNDGVGDVPHRPIPYHPLLEEPAAQLGLPMGPFDMQPLVVAGTLPQPPLSAPTAEAPRLPIGTR